MIRAVIFVSRHFVTFSVLAYLLAAAERVAEAVMHSGPLHELRANNLTQYFVNYPDHGFAKRALVGTLLRPLTQSLAEPELVIFWLMIALSVIGFAALLVLANRWLPHDETPVLSVFLRAGFAVGSAGVMQFAHDYGRFDLLIVLVLGVALWLVLRRGPILAAVACAAGILIHEGFAIFAVPLVVAVAWQGASAGQRGRQVLPVALASAAVALAVLWFGGSESAAALQIGGGAYVWQRGLIEIGWHLPWPQAVILAAYWLVLVAVLVWFYRANRKAPDLVALAAMAPLALNLFGIDHGRWLTIGFLIVTATLAIQVRVVGCTWPRLTPVQQWLAMVLVVPLGPHGLTGAWTWLL